MGRFDLIGPRRFTTLEEGLDRIIARATGGPAQA